MRSKEISWEESRRDYLGNSRGLPFLFDFWPCCPALSILPSNDYPIGTWLVSLPSVFQLLIRDTRATVLKHCFIMSSSFCRTIFFPSTSILVNKVVHELTCISIFSSSSTFFLLLCCQLVSSLVVCPMYPVSPSKWKLKFILIGKTCVLPKDFSEDTTNTIISTVIIIYLAHPLHQTLC